MTRAWAWARAQARVRARARAQAHGHTYCIQTHTHTQIHTYNMFPCEKEQKTKPSLGRVLKLAEAHINSLLRYQCVLEGERVSHIMHFMCVSYLKDHTFIVPNHIHNHNNNIIYS